MKNAVIQLNLIVTCKMRPRINQPQRVSQAEMDAFKGVPRPKRNKSMFIHSTRKYTYVFGLKVYITEDEVNNFKGFEIFIERQ